MPDNMRVMRVVLPVEQIRRMDQLIVRGAGGYGNRNEFISEAIEAQILELSFSVAEEVSPVDSGPLQTHNSEVDPLVALEVASSGEGHAMPSLKGRASSPLFGLHNRDYPSIWTLSRLALIAHDGPVPLTSAVRGVVGEAWNAGAQLGLLESDSGVAITSLFPTNRDKRDSAEDAFVEFALGSASIESGSLRAAGPLFEWGTCAVALDGSEIVLGLTEVGWGLLAEMDGLQPVQPHSVGHAQAFASFLKVNSPADWECFALVLGICDAGSPTRADLIEAFAARLGLASENVASTYAAGYVARCREWGFLVPKQVKGTYVITDLGSAIRKGYDDGDR